LQLDIILRGQSNAAYLAELDRYAGAGRLVKDVEQLLGFDGTSDSVRLVYDRDGSGGDTVYPASSFLGEWMQPDGKGGWAASAFEQGFLDRMSQYRDEGMGDATAIVWMHSEYDSRNPDLSATDWAAAVRSDAAMVRQALGREAPYLFVAAHPYGDGTDTGHQAIRAGMERLAADPAFDARIAARAPDIDASLDDLDGNPSTIEYGFAHITPGDAQLIAARIARSVAEEWAAHAKPGSPVAAAGGDIANEGPRVTQAMPLDATRLQVDVAHDAATGFQPLNAVAATGLGWSLRTPDGRRIEASAAAPLDADSLVVGFSGPVPQGAVLDYAWGIGRLGEPGGPGVGNAVTDDTYLPVWTPAEGIAVGVKAGSAMPAVPATPAATPAVIGTGLDPDLVMATGLARLAFGRPGAEGEVLSLQSSLKAGVSVGDTAHALADGPWFTERSAGLDDRAFVALVHQETLGRAPTEIEAAAWDRAFAAGAGREAVPLALAESGDFATAAAARAPLDILW